MSTESSFVTSATELRAYAPAADLSISSPASRANAGSRPLASRRDLRTDAHFRAAVRLANAEAKREGRWVRYRSVSQD